MRRFVALWPPIRDIADKNNGQTAVSLGVLRTHDGCGVLQLEKSML